MSRPAPPSRRDFLSAAAAGAAVASGLRADEPSPTPPGRPLRVGFVGVGMKGSAHLGNLLRMPHVEVVAVCDVVERQCVEARAQAERLGLRPPTLYHRGDRDFVRMCESEALDLVYTATPWRWHTPVCLAALTNGAHAATEVPAALTIEDCWKLVDAAEAAGRHCCMMENVNYQRTELAVLRMVRAGLLGELVHAEGAYAHDTRHLKASDVNDGLWLAEHHAARDGNLYPTHAIGAAAWSLNLGRGDRMEYLVSVSSNARGLGLYMTEHLPEGRPKREREYRNGDVNICLIKTANGRSISIKHDTDLPRPYSRRNLVQGTRGIVRGFPRFEVCLEANSNGHGHRWENGEPYAAKYEHPLWKTAREEQWGQYPDAPTGPITTGPITAGAVWDWNPATELKNGDYLEDRRLIDALAAGATPDMTVYDAAAWSAIAPLSERSVANRSAAVDFPDFTRGQWKTTPPLTIAGV